MILLENELFKNLFVKPISISNSCFISVLFMAQEHSTSNSSKLISLAKQPSSQREAFWKNNFFLSSRVTSFPSWEKGKHTSLKKRLFSSKTLIFKSLNFFTYSSFISLLWNKDDVKDIKFPEQLDNFNFFPSSGWYK